MKKPITRTLCTAICLFIFCPTFGQQTNILTDLNVCLNPSENDTHLIDSNIEWKEDVSARTLMSATYYSNDGQVKTRQSSRPINYYNDKGELLAIDAKLYPIESGGYAALDQPFPTYLDLNGTMSLTLNGKDRISFGSNCKIDGMKINTEFSVQEDMSVLFNAAPGIEKQIKFRENGVKYNYIVSEPIVSVQSEVVFSEEINLPAGYKITYDASRGKKTDLGWSGNIIVKDSKGNTVSTFHEPLCFDQARNYIVASYNIKNENGTYILETIVDKNWLNDSQREYPIIVDPIVTGPTAAWVGGTMPSCMLPTYNQDSILVTIPAAITVTELNITASFYADPFTGAWMQDGSMYFSTDCGNTQNFTITGAPGQSAGTAYLDYYNAYSPITCCFPESCSAQTFWLTYNLGRSVLGSGCNTTYIRYDPATTSWPFEAVVVGKTVEAYGSQWVVPTPSICANSCNVTGYTYAYYGVTPYTFTHPWSNDTITQGTNTGCESGSTTCSFTLNIPNCPVYCDTVNTALSIPPPVITDACGNVVTGMPFEFLQIDPVPSLYPIYDSVICSETLLDIDLNPCIPNSNVSWSGNGISGNSNISEILVNNSSANTSVTYSASAEYNGCYSDTIDVPVYIQPLPIAAYTTDPDPLISGLPVNFTDASVFNVSPGAGWLYLFGDGTFDTEQNPTHTYPDPAVYEICLIVTDDFGCIDTLCEMVSVAPAEIVAPNIVTANNDGINDLLEFRYLEFYPDNHLSVINRWGNLVFEAIGYTNEWNPIDHTEGTYFYLLKINGLDKEYSGFFQLVK